MGVVLSVQAQLLLCGVVLVGLILAYHAVSPKPLPGIPHNRDAEKKLLGDIPELMRYVMKKKQIFSWLTSLTARHQSPIVQAFFWPGKSPWVVVTDPYESQDILLRRTKEFDRTLFKEMILPYQHSHYLSTEHQFKHNRNLINHLMTPTFIGQVSAREVYKSVGTLIKVWQAKCDMAKGQPFPAHHDITYAALDAIFASSFGLPEAEGMTIQRLDAVRGHAPRLVVPGNADEPVEFPEGTIPTIFAAVLTIQDSVAITQMSPAPVFAFWILRKLPKMKKATAIKDQYIRDQVAQSVELIEQQEAQNGSVAAAEQQQQQPRSALHSVLLREREVAQKEGRRPDYYQRAIADEFFGFTMAGHDTTATAVAWGLKYLTDHPAVQETLRAALQEAFPEALTQQRSPTYQELSGAHVPYLDAVVEEVTRHANPVAFVARQAMQDTTVLGRRIPRGTDVLLMGMGPGYLEPNMRVDQDGVDADAMRSPGARLRGGKPLTSLWDDGDIGAFEPARWLKTDPETGAVRFDPVAGPNMAFGMGLRGCFGKRLALQALKLQFALLVWHFKFLKTPAELNSYDAVQKFAREPTQCYLRLERADF
ncbi:hypothetical protein PG987_012253 [Apiospora arundinis]